MALAFDSANGVALEQCIQGQLSYSFRTHVHYFHRVTSLLIVAPGAFASESDAENLKARLALSGWEAAIQSATLPDKSVRYRVRLGPYDNTNELNRMMSAPEHRAVTPIVVFTHPRH